VSLGNEGAGPEPLGTDQLVKAADSMVSRLLKSEGRASATQPLVRGTGRAPMDPDTLRLVLEGTLARAGRLAASLEPRVELMARACDLCGLGVPGVRDWGEYRHPVTPKAKKIVSYLSTMLGKNPVLVRQVQVAIFRYKEADRLVVQARDALKSQTFDDVLLEELKLKFYYLAHYHEEFKDDVLLGQLFPAPRETAPANGGLNRNLATSPAAIARYRQERDLVLRRAEALQELLKPGLVRAATWQTYAAESIWKQLAGTVNPHEREERRWAKRFAANTALRDQLALLHQRFEQLGEQMRQVKKGAAFEPLAEVIEAIGRLVPEWQQEPAMQTLYPRLTPEWFK